MRTAFLDDVSAAESQARGREQAGAIGADSARAREAGGRSRIVTNRDNPSPVEPCPLAFDDDVDDEDVIEDDDDEFDNDDDANDDDAEEEDDEDEPETWQVQASDQSR